MASTITTTNLQRHLDALEALGAIGTALARSLEPLDAAACAAADRAAEAEANGDLDVAEKAHRRSCGFTDLHSEVFAIAERLAEIQRRAGIGNW